MVWVIDVRMMVCDCVSDDSVLIGVMEMMRVCVMCVSVDG